MDTHPEWNAHQVEVEGSRDDWVSVEAMRAFLDWARAQGYASRNQRAFAETIMRRADHWAQTEGC